MTDDDDAATLAMLDVLDLADRLVAGRHGEVAGEVLAHPQPEVLAQAAVGLLALLLGADGVEPCRRALGAFAGRDTPPG